MSLEHINPEGRPQPTGYTHVVKATGNTFVYIAGQVGVDGNGDVAGSDLRSQADQVYKNLGACLASAGATFADVTKLTTFIVNYKPDDRAVIAEVRQRHLPAGNPPAGTLLGVQALALPELLIEVEATAVLA